MKFLKKRGIGNVTVRKVTDDEKTKVLCVVGTIGDLEKVGLLKTDDPDKSKWMAISNCKGIADCFGDTLGEAVRPFIEAGF